MTHVQHPTQGKTDFAVFIVLLALIALVAVPYGGVEPWWKAVFQCLVFALAAVSVVQRLISRQPVTLQPASRYSILWPVLALVAFAFIQTLQLFPTSNDPGLTLSADPFQTRQFILQLLALLLFGWLLVAHTSNTRRLRLLVETIIIVALATALFGLARAMFQKTPGFILSHLRPTYGYAQFINSNHFAFLMELALGLLLGIVVCGGVRGKRLIAYLVAAVPMWIAVVLSNSRGGILSILCQVVFLALLLGTRASDERSRPATNRLALASRNIAVRAVLVITLLVGAITTVVFVGGDPLGSRVDTLAVEMNRSIADAYTLRPSIWRATWNLIKDHPLAGVGFGGYWIAISEYHTASGHQTPQQAHNDYLELMASGGVVGVAIGLWFVVALIALAKRKLQTLRGNGATLERAATIGAVTGILTVAVHSLVDFGLHIPVNAVVFAALVAIVAQQGEVEGRRLKV